MNWIEFLNQYHVPLITAGKNVSRHAICNIKCPWCGSDDPSQHLSIYRKGYHCWRNSRHHSNEHVSLVHKLLRCSWQEAQSIAKGQVYVPNTLEMPEAIPTELTRSLCLAKPKEFRPLMDGSLLSVPFTHYMARRGYSRANLIWATETYDLHYATKGEQANRVIFPVQDKSGQWVSWTGRAIWKCANLRYKALDRDRSITVPKQTLLGLPLLWTCPNPRVLLVCEGPFDAMWVTLLGRSFGVYATCLFGTALSTAQALSLLELQQRFASVRIMLDAGAEAQAFQAAHYGLELKTVQLPGYKDPGDTPSEAIIDLCLSL